jgi:hypothetical protein
MIRLGYEVGTGAEVDVPLGHTIVCGQSQKAGKTTALEALAARAGDVSVLAFRTKRGEGAFGGHARVVAPFFRERADWQFVEAVLESTMRQKMRFERAWIMRATRGARTLANVQRNVEKLQRDARRGMDRDMYMMLGEYLAIVVPAVARLGQVPPLLRPGANVMDLVGLAAEVQGLVIATALEDVLAHRDGVVSVVPEAWEFMPQGRNSPVRMAAAALARKGAVLGNFLWVDSQDLAGVEKEVVRQAEVWLLGVQREANEVARSLACIPAGVKKPKVEDITGLGLGQFWCCLPGGVARKVYVQPAWMTEDEARAVARGELTIAKVKVVAREAAAMVRVLQAPVEANPFAPAWERVIEPEEEDEMGSEAVEALRAMTETMDTMIAKIDAVLERPGTTLREDVAAAGARMEAAGPPNSGSVADEGALYERFRARLLKDPKVLRVLATEKRIEVSVDVDVIKADGKSLGGRIALLLHSGWFDQAKTANAAWNEVKRRGYPSSSKWNPAVITELNKMAANGFLEREGPGYVAAAGAKGRVKAER